MAYLGNLYTSQAKNGGHHLDFEISLDQQLLLFIRVHATEALLPSVIVC